MLGIEVGATVSTTDGALLGIELGTADGSEDDGALFGMELSADNGASDGALLGHDAIVVVHYLVRLIVLLLLVQLLMVYCLASNLVEYYRWYSASHCSWYH